MMFNCRHCGVAFNDLDAPSEELYHESTETGLCFDCLTGIEESEFMTAELLDDMALATKELEDFAGDNQWEDYVIDGEDYPF
jgi:hypothetical protein